MAETKVVVFEIKIPLIFIFEKETLQLSWFWQIFLLFWKTEIKEMVLLYFLKEDLKNLLFNNIKLGWCLRRFPYAISQFISIRFPIWIFWNIWQEFHVGSNFWSTNIYEIIEFLIKLFSNFEIAFIFIRYSDFRT